MFTKGRIKLFLILNKYLEITSKDNKISIYSTKDLLCALKFNEIVTLNLIASLKFNGITLQILLTSQKSVIFIKDWHWGLNIDVSSIESQGNIYVNEVI